MVTKSQSQPVDMIAFMAWVGNFSRKFESDDISHQPRLYSAAFAYAEQWQSTGSDIDTFMDDMKLRALSGTFLTNGQAKGILNVARAQARFRSQRATSTQGAQAREDLRAKVAYAEAEREQEARGFRSDPDFQPVGTPYPTPDAGVQWAAQEAHNRAKLSARAPFSATAPAPRSDSDLADLYIDSTPALATYTVVFDEASDDRITIQFSAPTWGGDDLKDAIQISYLYGPENETDYKGTGFIRNGELRFWKRFKSESSDETRARIIAAICVVCRSDDQASFREAYALRSSRCARCNRKLTVPASIHRGLGPECARHIDA